MWCVPCTKYEFILAIQYFWIQILSYKANYWFLFIQFLNSTPQLYAQFIVGIIPGDGGSN